MGLFSSFPFNVLSRLRTQLAIVIALALAPAGVLAVVQGLAAIDQAGEQQARLFEARSLEGASEVSKLAAEIRQVVRRASYALRDEIGSPDRCAAGLEGLVASHTWLLAAAVVDATGTPVCRTDGYAGRPPTEDWDAFRSDPQDYLALLPSTAATVPQPALMAFRHLPAASDDRFALVIVSGLDVLKSDVPLTMSSRPALALMNARGEIVMPGPSQTTDWMATDTAALFPFSTRTSEANDMTGARRIYLSSAVVPGQLWAVTSELQPTVWDILSGPEARGILLPLALWVIAVGVAYFVIDLLVTRHITRLRRVALRIGEGHLDTPVGDFRSAPAEIAFLGRALHNMAGRISDRDAELRETLDMQRRLLLEIHHRVKNNLQIISSLMSLERHRSGDGRNSDAIQVMQDRIHSLALVHQNLYSTGNLEEVALNQLTADICKHLEASLAPRRGANRIVVTAEEMVVPTVLANPVALFLSEAIANAFKHGAARPDITVNLAKTEEGFALIVENAAPGSTPDAPTTMPETARAEGLGNDLMQGFAQQIKGTFEAKHDGDRYRVILRGKLTRDAELFSVRRKDDR